VLSIVSSPINVRKPQASKSASEIDIIAAGYDAVAGAYDSQLAPAHWIRERLWERMDSLFSEGARVLDVTAGTGLDALHLTNRGVHVVACDVSSAMLAQLHLKNSNIETCVADFNNLDLNGEFDGVISTFAGLNTARDLRPFAKNAARLLRPGGILFVHLLNRWPFLDIARYFISLRWSNLWRTIVSTRREVSIGDVLIPHYLYSPLSLYRGVFAMYFRLNRIDGQGIFRPVHGNWGKGLAWPEMKLASQFPFHSSGVFFSVEMIRV
jgi:SAM-dependent methyltransferase